jgi:hypothetical protein
MSVKFAMASLWCYGGKESYRRLCPTAYEMQGPDLKPQWLCPTAHEMQGKDLKPSMIMPNGIRNARAGLETSNDYAQRHTKCKGRTWNPQWLCPTAYEMQGPDLKPPMSMPNGTRNAREGLETLKIHSFSVFFLQKIKRGANATPSNSYTFGAPLD